MLFIKRMTDFYKVPRTGAEMQHAVKLMNGRKIPILLYSDVCRMMGEIGPKKCIAQLYKKCGEKMLILLQDPSDMNSGHWMSLTILPRSHTIYFFSSYGGKPDEEKNRWLDKEARIQSGQENNPLNDGLKELHMDGWTIHYNDYPYQVEGDGSATCGIWTAGFLNMDLNPDEFNYFVRRNKLNAGDFFRAFFARE